MTTTKPNLKDISSKVMAGERISKEEGLFLLNDTPLLELGSLAQQVRFRHNPERHVTFVIDTNLNYTNVCDAYCTFCAFFNIWEDFRSAPRIYA